MPRTTPFKNLSIKSLGKDVSSDLLSCWLNIPNLKDSGFTGCNTSLSDYSVLFLNITKKHLLLTYNANNSATKIHVKEFIFSEPIGFSQTRTQQQIKAIFLLQSHLKDFWFIVIHHYWKCYYYGAKKLSQVDKIYGFIGRLFANGFLTNPLPADLLSSTRHNNFLFISKYLFPQPCAKIICSKLTFNI